MTVADQQSPEMVAEIEKACREVALMLGWEYHEKPIEHAGFEYHWSFNGRRRYDPEEYFLTPVGRDELERHLLEQGWEVIQYVSSPRTTVTMSGRGRRQDRIGWGRTPAAALVLVASQGQAG